MKCIMRFTEQIKEAITVPSTDGTYVFKIKDIIRCTADINYTLFYFINGQKYLSSRHLGLYSEKLSEFGFVRIHKSHIVNPSHVKKINSDQVEMIDESVLPVARRRRKDVRVEMNQMLEATA